MLVAHDHTSKCSVCTSICSLVSTVLNCSGHTGPHAQSGISCLATSLAVLLRTDILVSKSPQLTSAAAGYGRYLQVLIYLNSFLLKKASNFRIFSQTPPCASVRRTRVFAPANPVLSTGTEEEEMKYMLHCLNALVWHVGTHVEGV